jgi:hypothetical protein
MVVGIEIEKPFRLQLALLLDDGFEQLLLVFEIHIERALGDAGGAGNVVHAGGVEALRQKDCAGALDDLAPLGAILIDSDHRPIQSR